MKHLAFLSVLAIVLPLSGLRAAPDKAKGNPFAFSNTDSQLLKDLWQIDSNLYSAQLDRYQKAQLCVEKAKLYARQDYYSTAISFYDQALELLQEVPGTEEERMELLIAQNELYEPHEDYAAGIATLFELIKLCGDAYPEKQALAHIRIGFFYTQLGNIALAETHFRNAREFIDRIPEEESATIDFLLYRLNNSLANIYAEKNPDTAFYFLQQAEAHARNELSKMQVIFQNKAVLYFYKKEYDSAEMFSNKALAITDDTYNRLSILFNIAELEQLKGNQGIAIQKYTQAIRLAGQINAIPLKVQILRNMADIYAQRQEYARSYDLLLESQGIADSSYVSESQQKLLSIQRDFEFSSRKTPNVSSTTRRSCPTCISSRKTSPSLPFPYAFVPVSFA